MAPFSNDRRALREVTTGLRARRRGAAFSIVIAIWLLSISCSPTTSVQMGAGSSGGAEDAAGSQGAGSRSSGGGASSGAGSSGSSGTGASGTPGATMAAMPPTQDAAGAAQSSSSASDASAAGADAGCASGMKLCGGACVDLASSAANCGACGMSCPSGEVCQNGACGCRTGQVVCSGACVDTTADAKNCGACGSACAGAMVCSQGKCASGCVGLLTACAGACVDTSGSSMNCGSCGHACPSSQSCWMGACVCPAGQGACGANGLCVDVTTSAQHCGTCSTVCATGASCVAGQCACPAGQAVCGGTCLNLNTDSKNCGTCGTACTTAGTQCLYGGCINPSSVTCGGGAMVGNTCVAYGSTLMGEYWVNNNAWGVAGGNTTGMQCIWGTCQTGDLVGWGTSWNWTPGTGQVKTYASLVFGWQWGWKVTNTGLPVQISANHAVNCGWDFTVTQTGTLDISYDTWLHSIANPGYADTPSEEVMIWLYSAGGAGPIGPTVASGVSLAGATWDLHQGQASGWPVSSYVRTSNATTSVMNLMEFYKDLVTRGWIPNTRYLSGVQTGTEVFTGNGSLITNGFYCRVQ